ncbi:hypothetical protein DRH13_02230 [Candidatus Woesebacteria bacterium]|nr:MAG: hypothetical protein DRH13_02230 [Candidatus Woesebacteria bacterium]
MDLKSFLSTKEEKSVEYYWALVVEPEWVQAGIWEIVENKARVIAVSPSAAWASEEELVSACDTVLSAAVSSFPEDAKEPSKTVFGVSSTWVSEGQIKTEYLKTLKKICADLSLAPVGFVVLPEVMAHLIKAEEGSPLSGVVLGVGSQNIELSIFKLGNLVGTANIARSVSVVDDVAEGLTRFADGNNLPSRFLLYDRKEGELEATKQALLKANWSDYKKIKFLHTPKIEVITPKRKVHAVSLAGASEIADVSSLETKGEKKKEEKDSSKPDSAVMTESPAKPEDVGFMVGQDVSAQKHEAATDVIEKTTSVEEQKKQVQKESQQPKGFKSNFVLGIFRKMKLSVVSLLAKTPKIKMGGKKTFALGGGLLLLLVIIGFISWWFLPKATVTIYVSPKKLDEKMTIFVDPDAANSNLVKGILPGDIIKTTVSGERTTPTSGTKTVGEKAKGSVTIQNGTAQSLKLPAGTFLYSAADIKFELAAEASVSAAVSPSSPGTDTVEVVAIGIGAEYNLAKDESFSVGNYPKAEVDAVAISDFSGGSSRQISAVSEEDMDDLEDDLIEELLEEAKNELTEEISEDQYFIEESMEATPSTKSFGSKVGDEADNLKLSLSLEVTSLVVENLALSDFAKEVLKDKIPSGYVLREDQVDMSFELEEEDEEVYELIVYMEINLLPEMKPDEIIKEIVGKNISHAKDYLTSIAGFTRAEINLKPPLPGWFGTLPHVEKNIEVELAAER